MQRHSKTVERAVPGADAMWNMDPQSIETMTRAYRTWFRQANRMRDETMRFAQDRFTKEVDAAMQLARCTDPNEALALQTAFANRMADDYLAEGKRIVELMGQMAKEISSSSKPARAHH